MNDLLKFVCFFLLTGACMAADFVVEPLSTINVQEFKVVEPYGAYIYAFQPCMGVRILDVSEPDRVFEAGRLTGYDQIVALEVKQDRRLYVVGQTRLGIYELDDPTAPELVVVFDYPEVTDEAVPLLGSDYLWISDGLAETPQAFFRSIKQLDQTEWSQLAFDTRFEGAEILSARNHYLTIRNGNSRLLSCFTDHQGTLTVLDEHTPAALRADLRVLERTADRLVYRVSLAAIVVDLTNPENLRSTLLDLPWPTYLIRARYPYLVADDGALYVETGWGRINRIASLPDGSRSTVQFHRIQPKLFYFESGALTTADFGTPNHPQIQTANIGAWAPSYKAQFDSRHVYSFDGTVFQVSDWAPGEPIVPRGRLYFSGVRRFRTASVKIAGYEDVVYLSATKEEPWPDPEHDYLLTIDVSNPDRPRLLHQQRIDGSWTIWQDFLVISGSNLQIFKITDPRLPRLFAEGPRQDDLSSPFFQSLVLTENLLVEATVAGFTVYHYERNALTQLHRRQHSELYPVVAHHENTLYFCTWNKIFSYDFSDPGNPMFLDSFLIEDLRSYHNSWNTTIQAAGDYLYVHTPGQPVLVLDISDPSRLIPASESPIPSSDIFVIKEESVLYERQCPDTLVMGRMNTCPAPEVAPWPEVTIACAIEIVSLQSEVHQENHTYTWYKDGRLLPNENGSTLLQLPITDEDGGRFTCVIQNECGAETEVSTQVVVAACRLPDGFARWQSDGYFCQTQRPDVLHFVSFLNNGRQCL